MKVLSIICSEFFLQAKESIKNKAGEIVADFKMRGKAALNRVSEFIGLKDKFVGIRNKVKEGIADTNRTIAKMDSVIKPDAKAPSVPKTGKVS